MKSAQLLQISTPNLTCEHAIAQYATCTESFVCMDSFCRIFSVNYTFIKNDNKGIVTGQRKATV